MIRGTKIKGYKELTKDKSIVKFNKPDIVYVPLVCGFDRNVSVLVKKNDYVTKGQVLGNRLGNMSIPILSSVSGQVIDIKEMTYVDNQNVKCVVIKNNFKEEEKDIKLVNNIYKYTKEEFIDILKSSGIRGQGGADFPTYIKYNNNDIKYLIVNAVECEPYITCDYARLKSKPEEILEAIDAILEINKIPKAYIAIKSSNKDIIKLYNSYIGMYPRISFYEVNNIYPFGWERNLVKEIIKKDYDKLPIEVNVVVNNVSTIYCIYEALKKKIKYTKRILTITGDTNKQLNVEAKIGTRVIDIIKELNVDLNNLTIAGGPMMGNIVDLENLVLSSNLNCLLIKEKKEYQETKCIRCSKCILNCPAYIMPVIIKENIDNITKLKQLDVNKCIECGLCSYICPSRINLREYVKEAKKKVGK